MAEAVIIVPGSFVRVGPDKVNEDDVLELAEALIEEHGHVKGTGVGPQGEMSVHHAIGEAAARITQESQGKSAPNARVLKDKAAAKFTEKHRDPATGEANEIQINDRPDLTQADAVRMLAEARA